MKTIDKLFPQPATNDYHGAKIARWFLGLLTAVSIARSLAHMLLPDGGAQSIATIPLDDFTANGAAAVIHIFGLWGLSQLLFGVFYAVVLWRYRSLIPLMYVFLFIEYTGRLLMTLARPIETHGMAPGAVGNYVMVPLALVMLALSLKETRPGR